MTSVSATQFTAACVQMCAGTDVAVNVDIAVRLVREAALAGANYVQTPEMTSVLNRDRAALIASVTDEARDPMIAALRGIARERRIVVHLGSVAVKTDDRLANRGVLIGTDGGILSTYDKAHLYDVDLPDGTVWRESRTYRAGDRACVVHTDLARFGVTICYDMRFPALYRDLALAGADVLTAPSSFTRLTGEAHWHVLLRARAIETGSFMIAAAQSGTHQDGRETYGHSLIVDPWGRVLADGGTAIGVTLAAIDLALVADARARIPTLRQGRDIAIERIDARTMPARIDQPA